MKQLSKRAKEYFHEIATVHTSEHAIGFGFALGALIAVLPTPGFSVLIGVLVVFLYPKVSKFALFGAMAVFNPLVLIPFHLLSLKVGAWLFAGQPVHQFELPLFNALYHFSRRYLIGNLIVAASTSGLSYLVVRGVVRLVRRRRDA